jgi:hypothetical protein
VLLSGSRGGGKRTDVRKTYVIDTRIGTRYFKYMKLKGKSLVEAVGVEPTSENVTGQEPTYLVQFTRRELPRQIRVLRLERTRNANR